MSSHPRKQLEAWLQTIDVPSVRVVDIGGSQLSVIGRVKSWQAAEYYTLDLEEPHAGKKPDIVGDIQDLRVNWDKFGEELVDIVFCLEVSEYWTRPLDALKNINLLLKHRGTLYISFHFIYPQHEPIYDDCLRYTEYGAIRLLKDAGFTNLEIVPRTGGDWPRILYQNEGMKMADGVDHSATGWLIKCIKE